MYLPPKRRFRLCIFICLCIYLSHSWTTAILSEVRPEVPPEVIPEVPARDGFLERAIVTGSSSNHFHVLCLFLQDYHNKRQKIPLFTYDLGLTETQVAIVRADYPWTTLRTFNFSNFPVHVNIEVSVGEYAWKPIIIKEMLDSITSAVLWLDSGNHIASADTLENTFSQIERFGHVTTVTSGTTQKWVHPATLAFLHEPNLDIDMSNGAIVGFNMQAYEGVVRPWAECAQVRECIAPPGSSRVNHRQDQAVLTVLLYKTGRSFHTTSGMWISNMLCDRAILCTPGCLGIAIQRDENTLFNWVKIKLNGG